MDDASWLMQRRLAAVARAGLVATQLEQIAALAPGLAALEHAGRAQLAGFGLTTRAMDLLVRPDDAAIDADLRWLATSGAVLLAATDPAYPELLRASPDAPAVLYVLGDPGALGEPQLSMVGSRNPTAGGRETAHRFAELEQATRNLATRSRTTSDLEI